MSRFATGYFLWWVLILSHVFIKLHLWLLLIRVCCITCWALLMNGMLFNVSYVTSISYLQGNFLFNPCLIFDRMAVIYECFAYANTLHLSVWSEIGHFWIHYLLRLVWFWILYLCVKGNPNNSILEINAVKYVCRIMSQNIYVNIQKIEL